MKGKQRETGNTKATLDILSIESDTYSHVLIEHTDENNGKWRMIVTKHLSWSEV